MFDRGIPSTGTFAELATQWGVVPYYEGFDAFKVADLLANIESLGDRILEMSRNTNLPQRFNDKKAMIFLNRLLECYAEPLKNTREFVQISIEIRKLEKESEV